MRGSSELKLIGASADSSDVYSTQLTAEQAAIQTDLLQSRQAAGLSASTLLLLQSLLGELSAADVALTHAAAAHALQTESAAADKLLRRFELKHAPPPPQSAPLAFDGSPPAFFPQAYYLPILRPPATVCLR